MQQINWQEWNEQTFEKAKKENKPVLLDIHGTWCHWCHVLDKEAYSDPEIIEFANQHFVAVKVDTDKRPDINERYNMGGWPTTAVLTPKGNILNGATYLPTQYMKQFLQNSLAYFQTAGEKIDQQKFEKKPSEPIKAQENFAELIEFAKELAVHNFDEQFGGFGTNPKFPMPDLLNFLNQYFFETKNPQIREIMEKTLLEMQSGGMFDQIEGGFFRYSTTQDWSIPHFEKMLEDNSQLIAVYINAFQLFKKEEFRNCAKKTINYALESLFDKKENYFFGTQDAYEHYYTLELIERKKLSAPKIDKTLFTEWNCYMVSSLLRASVILQDEKLKKTALNCLESVEKKCFDKKNVYRYFDPAEKKAFHGDNLADYSALALCFIDAFNYSLEKKFLDSAMKIFELIEKKFAAPDYGYFDISEKKGIGLLALRAKPLKQNTQMTKLLQKMHLIKKKGKFAEKAEKIIAELTPQAKKFGLNSASLAQSAILSETGLIEAKLSGNLEKNADAFLQKILQNDFGNILIEMDGKNAENAPAAMICRKNVCLKTVSKTEELENYEKNFKPIVWDAGNTLKHQSL